MNILRTLSLASVLGLVACASAPADESVGQDEAELRTSKSTKLFLDAIAEEKIEGLWEPPVTGTLLHTCQTRGIRGRITLSLYVTDGPHADSYPAQIVVDAKNLHYTMSATATLARDSFTTYQNDDVTVNLGGVDFGITVNDGESYGMFRGAFFDEVNLVCTPAPDSFRLL